MIALPFMAVVSVPASLAWNGAEMNTEFLRGFEPVEAPEVVKDETAQVVVGYQKCYAKKLPFGDARSSIYRCLGEADWDRRTTTDPVTGTFVEVWTGKVDGPFNLWTVTVFEDRDKPDILINSARVEGFSAKPGYTGISIVSGPQETSKLDRAWAWLKCRLF